MHKYVFFLSLATSLFLQTFLDAASLQARERAFTNLTQEERSWLDRTPDKLTSFFNTEFPPIEFSDSNRVVFGLGAEIISFIEKALSDIPQSEIEAERQRGISLYVPEGWSPGTYMFIELIAFFIVLLVGSLTLVTILLKKRLNEKLNNLAQTQKELRESETWFRAIFDNAPYPIVINRLDDGIYVNANKAFLKARDIRKEDLSKLHIRDITRVPEEYEKTILTKLKKEGILKNLELTLPKNDGSIGQIIYSSVLLEINGQEQILSMAVDVTEKKQAEEALHKSERRYVRAISATTDAIWEWDLSTNQTYYSPRWYEILGYSNGEIEMTLEEWKKLCHPEDLQPTLDQIDETLNSPGTQKFTVEFRMQHKDGGWRWILGRGDVVERDQNGKPTILSGTNTDITDRKKLEAQLIQSQKMEAIGRLAGGVAHDFNNMLAVITGYAEITKNQVETEGIVHKRLEEILKAAKRSANLTRQLLAFARQQTIDPKVIDLNKTIDGMHKMLKRLIGENVSLEWRPGSDLWRVKMDPTQIDQILANLCVNARDAIHDVGAITIETQNAVLDESYCRNREGFQPGEFVAIAVSDTGCGMDKKTQSQVFEPFFTTKEVGKGTGLGLSTVYGIVKQNQGFINLYSKVGRGTTFRIYIPRFIGESIETKTPAHQNDIQGHGETILLVEDDSMMLEMSQSILESQNYRVLVAASPSEAVRLTEERGEEINVLLTDVIMPEMNGRDLAEKLRALHPNLKCLYMSGYTSEAISHHGVLEEGVHFIQKPFSMRDLAEKIRETLDS